MKVKANMNIPKTEDFYALSVVLTGYSAFELHGTGVGQAYFEAVNKIVGDEIFAELLTTFRDVEQQADGEEDKLEREMRNRILSNPKLGPIARSIIKMWYLGNWSQLPQEWYDKYSKPSQTVADYVISAQSYVEGLVWKAMGSHPMGAKWPGFGTWSEPINVN
jgi:hypothetical protein